MKGAFAQAELYIIRARLHGAKLSKAHKGELRFPLPVGFVFDGDKIVHDPDQEVQGAIRAVFELFEQENSAHRVVQRFHQLEVLRAVHVGRVLLLPTGADQPQPPIGARWPGKNGY
jgi:DNA invertase Pin-like site-specific DNA recombinase